MRQVSIRYALAPLAGVAAFLVGVTIVASFISPPLPRLEPISKLPEFKQDLIKVAVVQSAEDVGEDPNDLGCWGNESDYPKYGPIWISHDRVLTTICGTLFVKDRKGKIIWRGNTHAPLTDTPKLIGKDLVVIGFDLHLLGIDPKTGEQNWYRDTNGRAVFRQLVPYRRDSYLIRVDMSGYDDHYQMCTDNNSPKMNTCWRTYADQLLLVRKDQVLDKWDITANSRIEVVGEKIFVTYRKHKRSKRVGIRRNDV